MKNLNPTKTGILCLMLVLSGNVVIANPNPLNSKISTPKTVDVVVKGSVVDNADGTALIGANIVVKGTTRGAMTDAEGKFILQNVTAGDTLVFTYMGYRTVEYAVPAQAEGQLEVTIRMDFSLEIFGAAADNEVYKPKRSAIRKSWAKVKSIL